MDYPRIHTPLAFYRSRYTRPSKTAAKTKVREGVKTLWVNGRVQIISLEEGDRAEAQDVDLHRAEYGTKWMLAQRGE
jgi:hypothetical protein